MIRLTIARVMRVYRRHWLLLVAAQLIAGLVLGLVGWGLLAAVTQVGSSLMVWLTVDGGLSVARAAIFGFAMILVFALGALPALLGGIVTVMGITDDELTGRRAEPFRWARAGLRLTPKIMAAVGLGCVVFAALFISAPVIFVLAIVALAVTPVVRFVRRRRAGVLGFWPTTRVLLFSLIPFALAAYWLARVLLALPVVVFERRGVIDSLRVAGELARSRRLFVVVLTVVSWLIPVLVSAGLSALGSRLGSDTGAQIAQVVSQLVLGSLPLLVLTVIYRDAAGSPTLPREQVPERARRRIVTVSPAMLRRVAMIMPVVLVIASVGLVMLPASSASAASGSSVILTVNSSSDSTDATLLDTQQQNCLAALGECTLRAALKAAEVLSGSGSTSDISVKFAGDTTVHVTARAPLVFDNSHTSGGDTPPGNTPPGDAPPAESPSNTGTITVDGVGHAVTLDGGGATQILSFFSHSWNVVVRGLELENGHATSLATGQGGALYLGGTTSALVDTVSFHDNVAIAGGGLYAGSATTTVQNSTFSNNSLAPADGNTAPGGADIFSGASVTAVNNTFAGSHGGSIYNWGQVGASLSLSNSLISVSASDAQGGFDCSGGGITGVSNVVSGNDTSCPGLITNAADFIAPLARVSPGYPPVRALLPSDVGTLNAALGASAAACTTTDARGVGRSATGCDAGAYEFKSATTTTLTSSANPSEYGEHLSVTATVAAPDEAAAVVGSVQFGVGGVDFGSPVTVVAGVANTLFIPPAAGSYAITAAFTPGLPGGFTASTAEQLSQVVALSGAPVVLQSDHSSVKLGDPVTLTIRVGDGSQTVTGEVTLLDITDGAPGIIVDTATLGALSTAAITTSALAGGSRTLVADYPGDANNAAGRSTALTVSVMSPSSTTIMTDVASAVYGSPVVATATVTGSGPTPSGQVIFTGDGGVMLGSALLNSGSATITVSTLGVGARQVFAHFQGDGFYSFSNSSGAALTISQASTSTVLADPGAVLFGHPTELRATVTDTAIGSTADPSGTVTFVAGGSDIGSATLVGNGDGTSTASYTTASRDLALGAVEVRASFRTQASDNFAASTSAARTATVGQASTAVQVQSDSSPSPFGSRIQFTATVAAAGGSLATPTGTVRFTAGSTVLGTATLSGGVATLGYAGLARGNYTVEADYLGATEFGQSSGTLQQVVGTATTTTTLVPSAATSVYGQPVDFTIAVAGSGGGLPGGTVVLRDGSTDIATIALVAGAASVTLSNLDAGTHHLHAVFAGDDDYLASEGQSDVAVTTASTTTTLQLSTAKSVIGDAVTLSTIVSNATAQSTLPPHGSVRFYTSSGLELGTVPLTIADGASSTVTLVTTAIPLTSHYPHSQMDVLAEFVPDNANFSGSSDTQTIQVDPGTTAISLTVTPATVDTDAVATATIAVTSGVGVPTGTVRFTVGGVITDVALVNGIAVLGGLRLPRGQSTVTAVYTSGDSNFLAGVLSGTDRTGVQVTTGEGLPVIDLTQSVSGSVAFGTSNTLMATLTVGGPAVTGLVTFSAVGPQGTTALGTATVTGSTATLTTTEIPVGSQMITASYSGDYNYSAVSSTPLPQLVAAAATTTTVTAAQEPSTVLVPVTYSATVRGVTGVIPSGTVDFTLDGVAIASSTLNVSGITTVTSTPQARGDKNVVAVFTPFDGTVTGSTGTLTHTVAALPVTTGLTSSASQAGIGESVTYTMSVTPTYYNLVTDALPTGSVVISDGAGTECTAALSMAGSQPGEVLAQCALSWNTGGSRVVTAVYVGDSFYAGATSHGQNISINKSTPDIIFTTSSERAWVGGETARLYWSIRGPVADGTVISVTFGANQTVCTSTAVEGSCDYTLPRAFSGAASFRLSYAGNAAWLAASASLNQQVTECVPSTPPTVSPAGAGTASADTAPNCAGGTGYLPGTVVRYSVTPNAGYIFDSWTRTDTVVATAGSAVNNQALLHVGCVTVRYSTLDPQGTGGQVRMTPEPNCGPRPQNWSYEPGNITVGSYTPGTVLTLAATAPPITRVANRLYSWIGLNAGEDATSPTTTITVAAGQPRTIYARFGIVCNHDVTFSTPANGTATLGPTNCTDPDGPGYNPGSTVSVSTVATGSAFFTGWSASVPVLSSVKTTVTGSTANVTVPSGPVALTAHYDTCVQIGVAAEGRDVRGDSYGTATVSPAGNCPTRGDGWYKPGSSIKLTAAARRGSTFQGWTGALDPRLASSADTWVTVGGPANYTARFANLANCSTLSLTSVPAGAFDLSLSFPAGDSTCPAGQYDRSLGTQSNGTTLVTVTATPKTAAAATALVGWTGASHQFGSTPDTTIPTKLSSRTATAQFAIYGDTQLTAWSCVGIDPSLTLVSPNGTAHTTPAPKDADFVNVDPAPNCGFNTSAYTTGSSVSVLANGPSDGYSFAGWSGSLTSADDYPTTPIVLDGSVPSVPITATYKVICHTLTTNFDNVAISPAPNCPDARASAHSYIGGTSVALQATGDGSLVFRGWNGPTAFSDGDIAGTNMTVDVALYANYTSKSAGEHITDIANTVGDALAITAKKAVGVAAAIATGFISGGNPIALGFTVVSLLGKAVGGIADLLGVDSAGLRTFQSVIAGVASIMTYMTSITTCATAWSAAADGGASNGTGAQDAAAKAAAQAAKYANQAGTPPPTNLGQAKRLGSRLGAVVSVGVGIYGAATSGSGLGWDSSATSAWTSGGDAYAVCIGRAIPSFVGLPPIPDAGTGG